MKQKTRKLALGCTFLLALSMTLFGLFGINSSAVAKAEAPITMLQSASIRLGKENEPHGIRFESTIDKDTYTSNTGAIYGTLICPNDYLATATNVLCHDDTENGDLYIYVKEEDNETTGNQYAILDIPATPEYNEKAGVYTIKGTITNVKDANLARPFAARSYIGVPNGEGGYTYTYSEVYSRSIYSVATHAVADTAEFATYTSTQQSYLDTLTDKVSSSITEINVSADKSGKISSGEEVKISASVTVDTKNYDGVLDVAPKFTAKVDGVESTTALTRVDANVYTLADLGKFALTPYVGKTATKTAPDIALDCNVLSIFTKASEITTDDAGKLDNPYINGTSGKYNVPDGNLDSLKNVSVGSFDGYDNVLSFDTQSSQAAAMLSLTSELIDKISAGTWLIFDVYLEDNSGKVVENKYPGQFVFQSKGVTEMGDEYAMKDAYFTPRYYSDINTTSKINGTTNNTTKMVARLYNYGIGTDGAAVNSTNAAYIQGFNNWCRIAVQFHTDDLTNFGWFMRTDLWKKTEYVSSTLEDNEWPTIHVKNMYLTTNQVPYTVELSGIGENKTYQSGETINLTTTAYQNGEVVENATNVISVDGEATLNDNVLTVGVGEIKVTVTNSTMNNKYPVFRTYTIKGETWENLTITGIDTEKTYAYNEIVTLNATANKVGESEAQTVVPTYTVTEGSAVVWQDEGQWYAKPGIGQSIITASFGGAEQTITFTGEANTIMLLGGATEEGVSSDGMLQAYFKNFGDDTSYYTYEKYNGRYAVNYTKKADSVNGLAVEDAYIGLANIDGYLYIDMYYESQGNTYFFVNGNGYNYFFKSYNDDSATSNTATMQKTDWQWYDMDGAAYTTAFNSNHKGRWVTLEIKLQAVATAQKLVLNKYPGQEATNMYISSVVISKNRLIEEKQKANAEVLYILDDEQALENYWTPGKTDSGTTNSKFTWTEIAGRDAVKYESLTEDCSPLKLDTVYTTENYYEKQLLKRYTYMYFDFYYEEGATWPITFITQFCGETPYYLNKYANHTAYNEGQTTTLPFTYQWYIDENNDGVLEKLTTAPNLRTGVWVTLEICYDPTTFTSYAFYLEKYPGAECMENPLYISNVRLANKSLTGITE